MKIVVVGGVAGGASFAARARRLSETAEIVIFERGVAPSFANCGLPYYVGGEIQTRSKLLVTSVEQLRVRHKLDVRPRTEVTAIDRERKVVSFRSLESGQTGEMSYDKLVLSPGAQPRLPPVAGAQSDRVHTIRDLTDADRLWQAVQDNARRVVIIGGGFIGVEMAENFRRRGFYVALIERSPHVMAMCDQEMTVPLQQAMVEHGVDLYVNDEVTNIDHRNDVVDVNLGSGVRLVVDLVVAAIGVDPENDLAKAAGLDIGPRGGIVVNEHQQTSDADIYAVGDAIETIDFITGGRTQVPLGGPANRQGRIAADHVFGRTTKFRGVQGTAIVGFFEHSAGMTGMSEKRLKLSGIDYRKIYLHPAHHAGYFPGAEQMTIKLLFAPADGKILGAQIVGKKGVDKRIDVLSMAIQAGMTVYDLEEVELAYAPQFGSAKDPINMAGFIAAGVLRNDQPIIQSADLPAMLEAGAKLIDVRTPKEFASGHIPGAVNIPVDDLRNRLGEIPQSTSIISYCKVGQRGYLATRILLQNGYDARNLSGGFTTWQLLHPRSE
ncbi:MAG: FAD-dependent oxidoreductase [Planctomycetaceae bacterium]|nr:FAD-dependent oxidoreductase [Planctomycetaceae bacterium]